MLPVERIGQEHSRLFLLPFFLSFRSSLLLPLSEYKDAVLCVGLSDSWKVFQKFLFLMEGEKCANGGGDYNFLNNSCQERHTSRSPEYSRPIRDRLLFGVQGALRNTSNSGEMAGHVEVSCSDTI